MDEKKLKTLKEAESVPDRLLSTKSYLSGDQECFKKMEYANPELPTGDESSVTA